MFERFSNSIVGQNTFSRGRLRGLILLLLCLGGILSITPSVEAAVAPPPPIPATIVMSGSTDFPEMVFVVYRIKADDPWATGLRLDSTTAMIVPAKTGVELPFDEGFAVLAVPPALAEKTKGAPDSAWLEPSAPGVVRVPGIFRFSYVFRPVILRYQLDKADKGPKLTLLNPEALKAAQQYPQYGPDRSAEVPKAQAPADGPKAQLFLWGLVAGGGGVLVLIAGVSFFWQFTRRNQPPAPDNPT